MTNLLAAILKRRRGFARTRTVTLRSSAQTAARSPYVSEGSFYNRSASSESSDRIAWRPTTIWGLPQLFHCRSVSQIRVGKEQMRTQCATERTSEF